ncbi:hypothetical protein Ciccas_010492 [Cichlidogyrus casuarinus]|uniref:Uncharacterized protein n=1 Tax=Cichlidogyrus casuarinus TaxID=1844966 RepID=A0ABD2PU04_9PLAT
MTGRKDFVALDRFRSGTPTALPVHKIVMLGKGAVGKSALLKRLMYDEFFAAYQPTLDDTYSTVAQTMDGSFTQFELIDTGGNHCFSAMRQLRLKIARVIILIFSLNDESSLEEVATILHEIVRLQKQADPAPAAGESGGATGLSQRVLMVANKQDSKTAKSQVLQRRAQYLLAQVPIPDVHYIETSAYTGFNVVSLFYLVFEPALMNRKDEPKLSRPSKLMSVLTKINSRRLSSREQAFIDEEVEQRKRSWSVNAESANLSSITDEASSSSGFISADSDTKSMQEKMGIELTKEIGRNLDPGRMSTSSGKITNRRAMMSGPRNPTPIPKRRAFSVFLVRQNITFHLKMRNLSIF